MDNPRPEKVAVVDEVRQQFEQSNAAILTEYRGLKVKDLAGLRRSLRSSGGEYKIYKNTLVRLAAKETGLEALEEMLVGPTGITFIEGDAAAVAKVLRDYSRTNPLLSSRAASWARRSSAPQETTALAELPSREVLLAQLAGAIAAPMQQFAALLKALPQNLAYGLAGLRDKQPRASPTRSRPGRGRPARRPEPAEAEVETADTGRTETGEPSRTRAAEAADPTAETGEPTAETGDRRRAGRTRRHPTRRLNPRSTEPWQPRKRSSTASPL